MSKNLVQRSGVWYISWRYKGQRHSLSTAIPVGENPQQRREFLRDARRALSNYQDQVRKARLRDPEGLWRELKRTLEEMPERDARGLRLRFSRELSAGASRPVTLEEAYQLWEGDPERGTAVPVTLRQYASQWKRFCAWCRLGAIDRLQQVGPQEARSYAQDLWASGISAGTYNAHVTFLRALWRVLEVPLGLPSNPWAGIRKLKVERQGRRELTEEELRRLIDRAPGAWRIMVALGVYTALRLGDVATLAWSAVDLERGLLFVVPRKTKSTQRSVEIPLHPALASMLLEWKAAAAEGAAWVFPEERAMYLKDRSALAKRFQQLLEESGVTAAAEPEGLPQRSRAAARVGFHSLRHTFVSRCRRAGVSDLVVAELVGHASPAMTRHYTHGAATLTAAAVRALPEITAPSA